MTITTIAVHVEPGPLSRVDAALTLPLAIAESYGAHVTVLIYAVNVLETAGAEAALPDEGDVARHVGDLLNRRGVRSNVRTRSSFAYGVGEVFADQLRVSDLGMLQIRGETSLGQSLVVASGIFSSGRPLLLVPPGFTSVPVRVFVAWDASPAAVRAVHGSLPLLKRADQVIVASVTDDKDYRPGQSAAELAHFLSRHHVSVEVRPVQRSDRSVMSAISAAASDAKADLLVMGAVRHSQLHNLVYGSATRDLIESGPSICTLVAA